MTLTSRISRCLALAALAGCAPRPPAAAPGPDMVVRAGVQPARWVHTEWPSAPGLHDMAFANAHGPARAATVWLPSAPRPRSLIIALHGAIVRPAGQRPMDPAAVSRRLLTCLVQPALGALDPVIIAPHSATGQWWLEADTAFVLGLVANARERWPELGVRSVVSGYSNGGIAAWYFARLYPEHFGAAIPMAFDASIVGATRLPVYAIQGDKDELFEIGPIRRAIESEKARGTAVTLRERHRATHLDACAYVPELSQAGVWLEREAWPRPLSAVTAPAAGSQPDADR